MRQRFDLKAERKIGLSETVSARALKVAIRISLSGFGHQFGIRPQRMRSNVRPCSPETTASTVVVGQTL
jgi:hypothetical protein